MMTTFHPGVGFRVDAREAKFTMSLGGMGRRVLVALCDGTEQVCVYLRDDQLLQLHAAIDPWVRAVTEEESKSGKT